MIETFVGFYGESQMGIGRFHVVQMVQVDFFNSLFSKKKIIINFLIRLCANLPESRRPLAVSFHSYRRSKSRCACCDRTRTIYVTNH